MTRYSTCGLLFSLLIFVSSAGFCFAQANSASTTPPPQVPPSTAAEYGSQAWKEFTSTDGRFTILFPGSSREETRPLDTPVGKFELHIHKLHTFAEYSVMYADYPPPISDDDPEVARRVLDNGLKGAVAEVNSELLDVKEISLDGHPGRAYKEKMPNGSILRGKTYLVGRRLYQIAITTPQEEKIPGDTVRFFDSVAAKFLDSFRLIKGGETNQGR
jgi:hypothetical protein